MTNEFQQFADELTLAPDDQKEDIIASWQERYQIIPESFSGNMSYTDDGVNVSVPPFMEKHISLNTEEEFPLDAAKKMASVWAEIYRYALATQPARDKAKELRNAVKQAGTDVPLDDAKADSLVEELNKLGYEIIKKD